MRSSDLRNRPPSWSYTDFGFRAMPCIKSSQIHSSRAVTGRRLVYGGHAGSIILRVLTPGPHECSKSCMWSFIPGCQSRWSGLFKVQVLLSSRKTPTFTPAAARSEQLLLRRHPTASRGACDAEGNRECNSGFCRRVRLGSCILSEISF